jgi:protein involved in polysaccharide export with SLBB domain
MRAGGLRPDAYADGTVFERAQVREFAQRSRDELARKLRAEAAAMSSKLPSDADASQRASLEQSKQQILDQLMAQPVSGRLVLHISENISQWANSSSDIEVRGGDQVFIPRKPAFVLISGQVFNPAAITFVPGKNASWYLQRAGGPSELADSKHIFVIRASGQVVGHGNDKFWGGSALDVRMEPGDTLVVPAKVRVGSNTWKNLATSAQMISALALAGAAIAQF